MEQEVALASSDSREHLGRAMAKIATLEAQLPQHQQQQQSVQSSSAPQAWPCSLEALTLPPLPLTLALTDLTTPLLMRMMVTNVNNTVFTIYFIVVTSWIWV